MFPMSLCPFPTTWSRVSLLLLSVCITPHRGAAASAAAAAFVLSAASAAGAAALDAAPPPVVLLGHACHRVDAASADSRDWICTSLI